MNRAIVFMFAVFLAATARAQSPLVVKTQSGTVQGVDLGGELAFLDIPFAAPPTGSRRWRPAQPPASWSGVRDATHYGNLCPQESFNRDGVMSFVGDEDCLNINVWVPKGTPPTGGWPVMVYYFGGGNEFGRNTWDPIALVKRGVIVAEPNYRLGKLGWFAHPLLVAEKGPENGNRTSPNYALTDQAQALRWLIQNIAAFGGNPTNKTIFGLSAGAQDCNALLADPDAQGLFERAILPFGWPFGPRLQDAEWADAQTAIFAGCGPNQPDDAVLKCLRDLPFSTLDAALQQMKSAYWNNTNGGVSVGPVVDGMTLYEDDIFYLRARVPRSLLVGYNTMDVAVFGPLQCGFPFSNDFGPCQNYPNTTAVADLPFYQGGLLGDCINPWLPYSQSYADQCESLYYLSDWQSVSGHPLPAPNTTAYSDGYHLATQSFEDSGQAFALRERAKAAAAAGSSVYFYAFTHAYENPNTRVYPLAQYVGGPWHATEQWFYFQEWDFIRYQPTPAESALADHFSDIWTNFARSGDPNGPGIPTWPRYDSVNELTMILDDVLHVVPHFRSAEDDFAWATYKISGPWVPLFPFPENGPCGSQFYCQAWLNTFLHGGPPQPNGGPTLPPVGPEPPNPYNPSWTIFQWPPTQMMIDGVGPNAWDAP